MFCKYCGTENASEAKFCTNCGASVEEASAQQADPQPTYTQTENTQETYTQPNQPNYNQYANYNPAPQSQEGKNYAIAGLVCGIISFFCFAFILGTLGIVFGCLARKKGYKGGMSIAAIICGAAGIILWIITMPAAFASLGLF